MTEAMVLLGCGDVGPIHEPMERYSELVRRTLQDADIRFAQVERTYPERGELRPGSGGAHGRLHPRMASVLTDCGFNVASVAGNHAMDWGPEPLLDTIDLLRQPDRGCGGREGPGRRGRAIVPRLIADYQKIVAQAAFAAGADLA